jgi:hypothetical protein
MTCSPDLDYAASLQFVGGYDCLGNPTALDKPLNAGILYAPDGTVAAQWADGSDVLPIKLPSMAKSSVAGRGVLVQDSVGRVYQLIPSDDGLKILVSNSSSVSFMDFTGPLTIYDPAKLSDVSKCGMQSVAAFSNCGSAGLKLGYVTIDELAANVFQSNACSSMQVYNVNVDTGDVSDIICVGGQFRVRPPSSDIGLAFHPLTSIVSLATITATGNTTVTLPNFPTNPPASVYALFQCANGFPGVGDIQIHNGIGGEQIFSISTDGGNTTESISLVSNGTVVFQCTGTVSSGSFNFHIFIKGYFY